MTVAEVAAKLIELCRRGDFDGAVHQLYGKDIVSVEGFPQGDMPRETRGFEAVVAKSKWWNDNHTVHSGKISDAYMAMDKFAVELEIDVTFKPTGKRSVMTEVAVYTVRDGKIVHEEFLYRM